MKYSAARQLVAPDNFSQARQSFNELLGSLSSDVTSDMNYSDLEKFLQTGGRFVTTAAF